MADIPTPEMVALVRRRYREGVTLAAIEAESGLVVRVIYRCLDGRHADGSDEQPAPLPRRRGGRHRAAEPAASDVTDRAALVARIWRTAEKQVEAIEQRLVAVGLALPERESNARMLAVLARTLREVSAVDDSERRRQEMTNEDHDESPPRNIDDLREALARKLQEFVAREAAEIPDDPE